MRLNLKHNNNNNITNIDINAPNELMRILNTNGNNNNIAANDNVHDDASKNHDNNNRITSNQVIKPKNQNNSVNLPWELWETILEFFTIEEFVELRMTCKMFSYIIESIIKNTKFKYIDTIQYYDENTYGLIHIMIQNELFWNIFQTRIGRFLMKLKLMKGSYFGQLGKYNKPYMKFITTRCLSFNDFKRSLVHEDESQILKQWGDYKNKCWESTS